MTWSLGFAACWTPPASGGTMEMITSSLDKYICLILTNTVLILDKYNWYNDFLDIQFFIWRNTFLKSTCGPLDPNGLRWDNGKGLHKPTALNFLLSFPFSRTIRSLRGYSHIMSAGRGGRVLFQTRHVQFCQNHIYTELV